MNRSHTLTLLSVASLATATGLLVAGPLDPPPGAIAPTMKTLSEIEPRIAINAINTPGDGSWTATPSMFKISSPGSYYLTANIVTEAGKSAIEIASGDVTLDLNGFSIDGAGSVFPAIRSTVAARNVTIRNGTVRGSGDDGIDLNDDGQITGSLIEGINASQNLQAGIRTGYNAVVRNCTASGNGGNGIRLSANGVAESCTAILNTLSGFSTGIAATVVNCSARENGGSGIAAGGTTTVRDCSVYSNTTNGIAIGTGGTVSGCTIGSNVGGGISALSGCVIIGNTLRSNGTAGTDANILCTGPDTRIESNNCSQGYRGIRVSTSGCVIIRNTVTAATFLNWDIAANNIYGPIIDRTSPASPTVTANSAAGTMGSTDPNANFTY
ncbi:MAG: right-handed parallel beta-helix repeat-containing protein [Planctomycetes bacterium]|nr:right-handed parallel beta-helix repeat-containing protein [Planctomycetota bacterium]